MQKQTPKQKHIPVLLNEVLEIAKPQIGEAYADMTAGYGGHAEAILELTKSSNNSVLIDRDSSAIEALKQKFGKTGSKIVHSDFLKASRALANEGKLFDIILADLGVSSLHLDNASRGFTFQEEVPLDMRMDNRQELTANRIINTYSVDELSGLLREFGEEPKSKAIAKAIVDGRPIKTTKQLADIVADQWKGRYHKRHPATRSFQAIRIAVNNELGLLKEALPVWLKLLSPGGRLCVISFHSLEDRIVKRAFSEYKRKAYDSDYQLLTPKPITATKDELVFNPRSRSAKLRAVAKIKIKERE